MKDNKLELLIQNYQNLDEEGKQKFEDYSKIILNQWKTKNLSKKEINFWSKLISVIKNQYFKYGINEILADINDIKDKIKE